MMIRVNGEYLDFNDDIEVESQIKLFEEIDSTQGDWSYRSEMEDTNHNRKILGIPMPDTIKRIYKNVFADVVDESGFVVYSGILRVENIEGDKINFSFFSGNNNWLSQLSSPLLSLPLYKYNVELTEANIQASWLRDSGIVFPIIDTGALVSRSFNNLKVEDFTSCFYVKTLFNEIFNAQGIKLEGDLLKDNLYNMLTIASNGKSQDDVDVRSCYVNKTTAQNNITLVTKVTFEDESTFPYFDGSMNNFSSSRYTADVKMIIDLEISLTINIDTPGNANVYIYKNGVQYFSYVWGIKLLGGAQDFSASKNISIPLEASDYIEIYADEIAGLGGNIDVKSGTIRIKPTYIYKIFGNSSVPNWTQGEFVSNILKIFNALPSYNAQSKTLTLDLFYKIKEKEEIDVSDDIEIDITDFSEFVSSYGKSNIFSYKESDDEDLRIYNIANFISYGSGDITVENDFLEQSVDVLDSDFTSPITYLSGAFDMSMERINFVELDGITERAITSIDDNGSGRARVEITDADDYFSVGDLIRIESNNPVYNGDWVVDAVSSLSLTVNGLFYDTGAATGTATLLRHVFTDDSNVYLFANVPNLNTLFFSSKSDFLLEESTSISTAGIGYFNILSNGREINTKYKQSLSFGPVNNPLNYQRTMLDTYWPIFKSILNDPVMLRIKGFFDRNKFTLLKTFLRPLRVRTNETNNLYYLNRVTGYKSKDQPCECELIKL